MKLLLHRMNLRFSFQSREKRITTQAETSLHVQTQTANNPKQLALCQSIFKLKNHLQIQLSDRLKTRIRSVLE